MIRLLLIASLLLLSACHSGMNTLVASPVARTVASNDGSFTVYWVPKPDPIPLNQFFQIEIQVLDIAANPITPEDATLKVDAGMPQHGHGMNHVARVVPQEDGTWLAEGLLMHMPGDWQLYFDLEQDGVSRRAQTPLVVD
ncbi:MAG: hypothetical protein MK116_00385 [Phycisphaerales bacterium]|nr:hypothetical protein [Phycisphaerales bacterium]